MTLIYLSRGRRPTTDTQDVSTSHEGHVHPFETFLHRESHTAETFLYGESHTTETCLYGESPTIETFLPPKNGLIALWPSTNGAIP